MKLMKGSSCISKEALCAGPKSIASRGPAFTSETGVKEGGMIPDFGVRTSDLQKNLVDLTRDFILRSCFAKIRLKLSEALGVNLGKLPEKGLQLLIFQRRCAVPVGL
jgi:hypothetical protein